MTEKIDFKRAIRIRSQEVDAALATWSGDARLYRLDPPMSVPAWDNKDTLIQIDYVVVSAVVAFFQGPETYIFPANENGEVLDWMELDGSFKGGLNHGQALTYAGYISIEGELEA